MMLQWACDAEAPRKRAFANDESGRARMMEFLRGRAKAAGGATIVFAYEAGPHGFGLHDAATDQGIVCHVLAPSKMARSPKARRTKTDEKDALAIFETLRGHLLAGNALPSVWVPDPQTREDREVVRARLDAGAKQRRVQTQIRMLLKRSETRAPQGAGKAWSAKHRAWLRGLSAPSSALGPGARTALGSLLRQFDWLEGECAALDRAVADLARQERWRAQAEALDAEKGVGLLTAMIFLTELGDVRRFSNRRQLASYLGLVPSSDETGERADCKGHITRHGSPRLRWALCQAAWTRVRTDPRERAAYERLVAKRPKKKKIAIVARMRCLGIGLWHCAVAAAPGTSVAAPLPSPRWGEAPVGAAGASAEGESPAPPRGERRRRAV